METQIYRYSSLSIKWYSIIFSNLQILSCKLKKHHKLFILAKNKFYANIYKVLSNENNKISLYILSMYAI